MKRRKEGDETYLIFARKFRPETFDEVVGQETITRLLTNAIRTGRIPQSFLFAGPRGVGKTSTARILAKALNCAKGLTEAPCGDCLNCREIARANSLDVLEIDGASNRGIDEVRTLRENVKFKPAGSRFKIYIIDEVHQITHDAFNALLKTLEEPPGHVKFIFATTEPHKVPLTILSRCQRFNFKRIPVETMTAKLTEIAKAEHLKCEAKALFTIARASDGSLRDAESLFDQLSTLSEGEVREEDVLLALGLASEDVYFELLAALVKKEPAKVLSVVEALYESGKDLVQFGRGLLQLFRDLLLVHLGSGAEAFVEGTSDAGGRLRSFKNSFTREELLLALSLLQNLQGDLRRAVASPRILLEAALLKLLHLHSLHAVDELLDQAETNSGTGSGGDSFGNPSPIKSVPLRTGTNSLTLNDVERIWPEVLEAVKAKQISTGLFLAESQPAEVTDQTIILGLPQEFQFHKETLEGPEKRKMVAEAFAERLGFTPAVEFVTMRVATGKGESKPAESQAKLPDAVRQAMEVFEGSKIVRAE